MICSPPGMQVDSVVAAVAKQAVLPGLFWLLAYVASAIVAKACTPTNGTRVPEIVRLLIRFSGPHRLDVVGLQLGLLGLSVGLGGLTSVLTAAHADLLPLLILGQVVALMVAIWLSLGVTRAKLLGTSHELYVVFGDPVPQLLERYHIRPWRLEWAALLLLQGLVAGVGIGSTAVGMWVVVG